MATMPPPKGTTMFVLVCKKNLNMVEVERYFSNGQNFITGLVETELGGAVVIESDTEAAAQILADRLASGLFWARNCDTYPDAISDLYKELIVLK